MWRLYHAQIRVFGHAFAGNLCKRVRKSPLPWFGPERPMTRKSEMINRKCKRVYHAPIGRLVQSAHLGPGVILCRPSA